MFRIKIIILFALILSACEEYGVIKVYGSKEQYAFKNAADINFIQVLKPYNTNQKVMKYRTGGSSGGEQYIDKLPSAKLSTIIFKSIEIDFYSTNDIAKNNANELSLNLAKTLYYGTKEVWPLNEYKITVQYFLMDDDEAYTFAKKVYWKEGEPLQLLIFQKASNIDAGTVLHEFYHLLSEIYKIGLSDYRADKKPRYYGSYEEFAGDLYGLCGELVANRKVKYNNKQSPRFTAFNKDYIAPLSRIQMNELVASLANEKVDSTVRGVVSHSIIMAVLNSNSEVNLLSKEGQKLIELCKQSAGNPTYLESWIKENYR